MAFSLKAFSKIQIATATAILFHVVGLAGILIFHAPPIINSTPLHLLLMFILLVYTQPEKNRSFYLFMLMVMLLGFMAEFIGVHTGYLFGDYSYGTVLGPAAFNIPIVIAINWFIIIYCCGIAMQMLLQKVARVIESTGGSPRRLKAVSLIVDGATIAVFWDWLIEPAAIKLGFWKWGADGGIPVYNYFCWLCISALLLAGFHGFDFRKENKFAIHLLLIQLMFFLLLRLFL